MTNPLCHVYGKVFIDTARSLAEAQEEPHRCVVCTVRFLLTQHGHWRMHKKNRTGQPIVIIMRGTAYARNCIHSDHRFPAPKEGCRKPVLGVWEL